MQRLILHFTVYLLQECYLLYMKDNRIQAEGATEIGQGLANNLSLLHIQLGVRPPSIFLPFSTLN